MNLENVRNEALRLDSSDPLSKYRDEFLFPQHDNKDVVYLCGNSLGLLPKRAKECVAMELDDWAMHAVEGHFRAKRPWFDYHKQLASPLANLVGAGVDEVVCMNSLTVNIHLLLSSFYRPTPKRSKILILSNEFPSDRYALQSQVRFHGLDPASEIIELRPRVNEETLRTEDILATIRSIGSDLALMHCSAVHYYTGQFFDMKTITACAKEQGAVVGWDLAHAIGNVPLNLHAWGVDYAAWCSYKYLNSGPGGVGGAFIHREHCQNPDVLRLAGWWGNNEATRFTMPQMFQPVLTAESWQLSNAPVVSMAIHKASLDIFSEAGIDTIRSKSIKLSAFFYEVIDLLNQEFPTDRLNIISPPSSEERGAQISTVAQRNGRDVFEYLNSQGVISDWRNPNVIRMAPAPLYCRFADISRFADVMHTYYTEKK